MQNGGAPGLGVHSLKQKTLYSIALVFQLFSVNGESRFSGINAQPIT